MTQQEHNQQNITGQLVTTKLPVLPEGTGEEKTYHTRYPGSTFITREGEVIAFNGAGNLTTDRRAVQFELDQICDKPGSPIFTKAPVLTREDLQPAMDQKTQAANVIELLQQSQNNSRGG